MSKRFYNADITYFKEKVLKSDADSILSNAITWGHLTLHERFSESLKKKKTEMRNSQCVLQIFQFEFFFSVRKIIIVKQRRFQEWTEENKERNSQKENKTKSPTEKKTAKRKLVKINRRRTMKLPWKKKRLKQKRWKWFFDKKKRSASLIKFSVCIQSVRVIINKSRWYDLFIHSFRRKNTQQPERWILNKIMNRLTGRQKYVLKFP